MRTGLDDLDLDHLWIVYPGSQAYPVDDRITVWPLQEIGELRRHLQQLKGVTHEKALCQGQNLYRGEWGRV